MVCLLIVAIVYFIMPTLRDLVGNIVTTISLCLIVNQAADLIRLLTVFTNHVSLIITGKFEVFSLATLETFRIFRHGVLCKPFGCLLLAEQSWILYLENF